jgi:hypothetical protein
MFGFGPATRIYVATGATDMRIFKFLPRKTERAGGQDAPGRNMPAAKFRGQVKECYRSRFSTLISLVEWRSMETGPVLAPVISVPAIVTS